MLYREHSIPQFAFYSVLGCQSFLQESYQRSADKAPSRVPVELIKSNRRGTSWQPAGSIFPFTSLEAFRYLMPRKSSRPRPKFSEPRSPECLKQADSRFQSREYGTSSHVYQDHPIPRLRREKRLCHLTARRWPSMAYKRGTEAVPPARPMSDLRFCRLLPGTQPCA